jgi:hypothetical protein
MLQNGSKLRSGGAKRRGKKRKLDNSVNMYFKEIGCTNED